MIAPTDADGFVISFEASQVDEIRAFFDKFGFVCVRNVLSDAEIAETSDAFFAQFDRDDDASIEEFFQRQRFGRLGVIGLFSDLSLPALRNRQRQSVYDAFVAVLNQTELIVDHDRFGALRPTFRNGVEKASWRTIDRWLHLDCNPVSGKVAVASFDNGSAKHDWSRSSLVQGFLTLTDAADSDGGFHCVPGSHKFTPEWVGDRTGATLPAEEDDPVREQIQRIAIRRGCLMVWNAFLLHANRPNFSENWRLVMYIRMYPAKLTPFKPLMPNAAHYPAEFEITPLGRKLFGIDEW